MKKVIFIVASLIAVAACNKLVINVSEQVGYLSFALAADDIIVTTKEVTVAQLDEYTVYVGEEDYEYGTEIKGKVLNLKPDTYTVYAENMTPGAAHDGNGSLRVASESQNVTVEPGETSEVTLACKAVNAKITVTFDDSFKAAFSSWDVTLGYENDDTRNKTITHETSADDAVFFYNIHEKIKNLTFVLSAINKHDSTTKTKTTSIELKAGHHFTVNYSAGTSGYVDITVTADDSLLNGGTQSVIVNPYQAE